MLGVTPPKSAARDEPVSSRLIASLVHPDRSANVAVVRFSADGRRLFVAGYPSGVLQFYDVARREEINHIETPRGYRGTSQYVALTADWSTAYVPWDRLRRVRSGKDGEPLTWYDHEGGVLVYDVASGRSLPALRQAARRGVIFAFVSPDGAALVSVERYRVDSNDSNTRDKDEILLWDTRQRRSKILGAGYGMAAVSPDSTSFAICVNDKDNSTLQLFDVHGTELAKLARVNGRSLYSPTFSADGKLLCVEEGKGRINRPATLRIWDAAARREIASIPSGGDFPFRDYCFSPDGKHLAASDYKGAMQLWDIPTGKTIWRKSFGVDLILNDVRFSPDGTRLAAYGQPKWKREESEPDPRDLPQPRVFLFDLMSSALEPEVLMCPHGYVGGLDFSPDGKLLAAGGCGATHLFDVTPRTSHGR
jgi:WD40 repeat protein